MVAPFVAAHALPDGSQARVVPAEPATRVCRLTLLSGFTAVTTSTWMLVSVPPCVKLLRMRMSPTSWVAGLPFSSTKVPLLPSFTTLWKNQKPIWASPLLASRSAPK